MTDNLLHRALLLDTYAAALTPRQCSVMQKSVNEDFSLAELAQSEGITRQGVRDALLRAEEELQRLEAALRLVERLKKQDALLAQAELLLQGEECAKLQLTESLLGIIKAINTIWENDLGI